MALETNIEFKGTDDTGRVLNVQDTSTGWDINSTQKTDVQQIRFEVSKYDRPEVYSATWYRAPDPNDPLQFSTNPIVDEILSGVTVGLTSLHFGITTPEQGLAPFNDGVYDINAYYIVTPVNGVFTGQEGDIYLQGVNTQDIVEKYDSVVVADKVYQIDKTKDTNAGTLLYISTPLEDSTTVVAFAHRANTKGLNVADSSCAIKTLVAKGRGCEKHREKLVDLLIDNTSANVAFCQQNWEAAHELATDASLGAKQCGCGCK